VQVPEGRRLFPYMTVHEIFWSLVVAGGAPGSAMKTSQPSLSIPKLGARAQLAGTLSGASNKLVAIARALMASPRLLLLDENQSRSCPHRRRRDLCRGAAARRPGADDPVVEQEYGAGARSRDHGYVLETKAVSPLRVLLPALPRIRASTAYLGI